MGFKQYINVVFLPSLLNSLRVFKGLPLWQLQCLYVSGTIVVTAALRVSALLSPVVLNCSFLENSS